MKKFLSSLFATAMLGAVIGCGGASEAPAPPAEEPEAEAPAEGSGTEEAPAEEGSATAE
ncbi:MAG: hypothetical protein AAGB00_07745 [Planctomycetota bacterium]